MEKCEIQLNSIDCYFFCEAYIFPWAESEMSKLPRPPMKISNCYLQGKDLKAWGSSSCGVNDRRLQLEVYAQDSRHSNSFRWIIELYFGRIKFKSCIYFLEFYLIFLLTFLTFKFLKFMTIMHEESQRILVTEVLHGSEYFQTLP